VEPDVRVNIAELKGVFSELQRHSRSDVEPGRGRWPGDLLPGWNEEWVQVVRERLRQMRAEAPQGDADDRVTRRPELLGGDSLGYDMRLSDHGDDESHGDLDEDGPGHRASASSVVVRPTVGRHAPPT
jgi:hypothetical protein